MEKEIEEIIKKNLPEQVGEVLKERLLKADEDALELVKYKRFYEDTKENLAKANARIEEYKKLDERNAGLEKREKELEAREREFKIHTLEYQIAAEKDKTIFSQQLALGLVRNTNYRESIFDNEHKEGYYDNTSGKWVEATNVTKNYNKDITKD